jgi:NAD(P)-dependent dehydrogenase (short-subunit alcohol dehydrogenase family)
LVELTKISSGIALITGAAKRIGRSVSIALAEQDYDIGVHYSTSEASAFELVSELKAMGVKAFALQADLNIPSEAKGLVKQAVNVLGPIKVLINNASVFFDDRLGSMDPDIYARHMNTNLLAPVLLSQAFANQAHIPEGASIINLIDQRVLKPSPPFFSYGLSKAGLWHATRTMAQELAPHIRVNAVGPGPTLPSIHQSVDAFDKEAASTLLQRRVTPDEISSAVVYLIGAHSMTGQMICVDSGQHLNWQTQDMI